jgi:polyvinyl alcohol dehydrogenase (cytochrome)
MFIKILTALPIILLFGLSGFLSGNNLPPTNRHIGHFIDTTAELGKKLFETNCSSCHKDSVNTLILAPSRTVLLTMTPRAVLSSLQSGKMRAQAAKLSENEKKAVAQWATQTKLKETEFPKTAFTPFSLPQQYNKQFDCSGWGGNKEGTGYRTAAQAGINLSNVSGLKLAWAFAFPDGTVTRSKPAIVGNWLIVGGQFGDLFAIQRKTGKIGWHFVGNAAIRGGITIGKIGNQLVAFFADYATNAYAVNMNTGKLIWSQRVGFESQSTNTGTVAYYNGIVYVPISSLEVAMAANGNYPCCSSSGGVVAVNAATGKEIWRHRVVMEPAKISGKNRKGAPAYGPSGAPVWCSPTVDAKRGLLYIGTGENYSLPTTSTSDAVQALNLQTGKLVWNYQATTSDAYNVACPVLTNCPPKAGPDLDFGMAPMLTKADNGKDILIAGQKSGVVHALDPSTGKLIWKLRVGKGGALGGIHWGMATDGKYVYAANADNSLALDRADSTVAASPGLYSIGIDDGKLVWKTPSPACESKACIQANSAAPTVIPGLVFAATLDGHIRAYATSDGNILWDFNTNREFETVNGIKGTGGSIDGPPPLIADGMIYLNSGYGMFGQTPGNVLLAFTIGEHK